KKHLLAFSLLLLVLFLALMVFPYTHKLQAFCLTQIYVIKPICMAVYCTPYLAVSFAGLHSNGTHIIMSLLTRLYLLDHCLNPINLYNCSMLCIISDLF